MQNRECYLADLRSKGKNIIETVEKSSTETFIRLLRIYPCLSGTRQSSNKLLHKSSRVTKNLRLQW